MIFYQGPFRSEIYLYVLRTNHHGSTIFLWVKQTVQLFMVDSNVNTFGENGIFEAQRECRAAQLTGDGYVGVDECSWKISSSPARWFCVLPISLMQSQVVLIGQVKTILCLRVTAPTRVRSTWPVVFKSFSFSPRKLGKWSNLTNIFFKGIGSTSNYGSQGLPMKSFGFVM